MAVSLPDITYKTPGQISTFLSQLADHMQTVLGVVSTGLVTCAPVAGHCDDLVFFSEGHPQRRGFDPRRGGCPGGGRTNLN
jgi:hypothetical protein